MPISSAHAHGQYHFELTTLAEICHVPDQSSFESQRLGDTTLGKRRAAPELLTLLRA